MCGKAGGKVWLAGERFDISAVNKSTKQSPTFERSTPLAPQDTTRDAAE